nr:hypothetical protein GCM10020185_58390 [Pseudomonas brassicacearum subsp. brassicacearum]
MIVDRQGRRFRNLRISLTSACNYACTYCVPDGKRLVAAQDELSAEAMARGVAYLIEAAGIERLRITGGEPLVSPKLERFMTAVGQMGLEDISLTTNGQLLAKKTAVAGRRRYPSHQRFPRHPGPRRVSQYRPWRRPGDRA